MFDQPEEARHKRRVARNEAARAFVAVSYGATAECWLTRNTHEQLAPWVGHTELESQLQYEQELVVRIAGPVCQWIEENLDRRVRLDVIVDELFGNAIRITQPSHEGLPLDDKSQLENLVGEAMEILYGSETQLLDTFAEIICQEERLTADRCDQLAEEVNASSANSRAIFEAGFAVGCVLQGLDSPASFEVAPGGCIEADVLRKLIEPQRDNSTLRDDLSDMSAHFKDHAARSLAMNTGLIAETLFGNSDYCRALLTSFEDGLTLRPIFGDELPPLERARKLVDKNKESILTVADELRERQTLTIEEVRNICGLG